MMIAIIIKMLMIMIELIMMMIIDNFRPGNYDLTDKFYGGTNARKSGFPKGKEKKILFIII